MTIARLEAEETICEVEGNDLAAAVSQTFEDSHAAGFNFVDAFCGITFPEDLLVAAVESTMRQEID